MNKGRRIKSLGETCESNFNSEFTKMNARMDKEKGDEEAMKKIEEEEKNSMKTDEDKGRWNSTQVWGPTQV